LINYINFFIIMGCRSSKIHSNIIIIINQQQICKNKYIGNLFYNLALLYTLENTMLNIYPSKKQLQKYNTLLRYIIIEFALNR
jgi:hypothetical protein